MKNKYKCLIALIVFTFIAICCYYKFSKNTVVGPSSIRILLKEIRYSRDTLPSFIKTAKYWEEYFKNTKLNRQTGVMDFEWIVQDTETLKQLDELKLGKLAWHRGDFEGAVSYIESWHKNQTQTESSNFWLSMSYMRLAETKNCLDPLTKKIPPSDIANRHLYDKSMHDHSLMCSLPLTIHHTNEEYSRKAAEIMKLLLDEYGDNPLYQWLLNFNYMTINMFPGEVPEKYQIKGNFIDHFYGNIKDEMAKKYDTLKFRDVAKELNVNTLDAGKGVAVEDFDRDGFLDIITGGLYGNLRYYWNNKGMGFIDKTNTADLSHIRGVHLVTAADYDNDGWIDIFASLPNFGDPIGEFKLLRNNGNETFTDVTITAGLLTTEKKEKNLRVATWTPAWGDVDNDGDLDLFLANAIINLLDFSPMISSRLYINSGGQFTNQTKEFGLDKIVGDLNVVGAAFGDYDNDGYLDLVITSWERGIKSLLKNIDGKQFQPTNHIIANETGFMASFVDVNHDGLLDVFFGGSGIAEPVTEQVVFGKPYKMGHSSIWIQKESGHFEEKRDFFSGEMPIATMGSSFGDINNDGAYDFYLGTGTPEGWFVLPNLMYVGRTNTDGTVTGHMDNISMLFGFGTIQKGHGIVFFDFDNDGDQDIYSSLGGMWPGDKWPNQLFLNESQSKNSWVKIRLKGSRSNSYGLGAKIKVIATRKNGGEIKRYYLMDNKTGFGSSPYLAHIGLLDAIKINHVEVTWPGNLQPEMYQAKLRMLNVLEEENIN